MSDRPAAAELKGAVHDFWDAESCGERYFDGDGEQARFDAHARTRYRLEPFLFEFARFHEGRGKRVLEIGVGLGADFLQWLQAGAKVTGIDLTPRAIERAGRRSKLAGFPDADLRVGDAEALPFDDDTFDIVYSWGVLHHSPDTARAVQEVRRVLKPGGVARVMVYHDPSWVGLMLWARHALARGKPWIPPREVVFEHLESPGTKVYSVEEGRRLFADYQEVSRCESVLCPADLLTIDPSEKHQGLLDRAVWRLWPRWLIRAVGDRMGSFLLIEGRKQVATFHRPTAAGQPRRDGSTP